MRMRWPFLDLTPADLKEAFSVAQARQKDNERWGRVERGVRKGRGWKMHLDGVVGELAVARHTNLPWTGRLWEDGRLHRSAPDVGTDLQVKTVSDFAHNLLLRGNEPETHRAILVVWEKPWRVHFIGWIPVALGRTDSYWAPWLPQAAWLIPKKELRPMEELET